MENVKREDFTTKHEEKMTLQEVFEMDEAGFQKACQDTEAGMNNFEPINAGITLDEAVKSFDAFESTPQSILAIFYRTMEFSGNELNEI